MQQTQELIHTIQSCTLYTQYLYIHAYTFGTVKRTKNARKETKKNDMSNEPLQRKQTITLVHWIFWAVIPSQNV